MGFKHFNTKGAVQKEPQYCEVFVSCLDASNISRWTMGKKEVKRHYTHCKKSARSGKQKRCEIFLLCCVFVQPIFDQFSNYVETRQLVFTSKMFEKHLCKSDILSKDASHLSLNGTLVENGLRKFCMLKIVLLLKVSIIVRSDY